MSSFLRFDGDHASQAEAQYHSPEMVAQREHVRRHLALAAGERVLDIGCGPAILGAELATEVGPSGRVDGVDISESMLALARARCAGLDWVGLQQGRAEELPFDDDLFDAAVAVQVYEYVPDIEVALREVWRALRPGGRAVILDTDWDSIVWFSDDRPRMQAILESWDGHLADPHLPARLGPFLRRVGFEVESPSTMTFVNDECHQGTYSYWLIGFVESFIVEQGLASAEVAGAWSNELRALAEDGRYFFSLDRYAFTARKPLR